MMKTLSREEFGEVIETIIKAGTFKYDGYLAVMKEKEKAKELEKEQPLDMDRLYMYGDELVKIYRNPYGPAGMGEAYCGIENVITGRKGSNTITGLLTLATKEQIMDAYGFQVGDEKVVWYEDEDGEIILKYPGRISFRAVRKALLEAAGQKYIPNVVWEKINGNTKSSSL